MTTGTDYAHSLPDTKSPVSVQDWDVLVRDHDGNHEVDTVRAAGIYVQEGALYVLDSTGSTAAVYAAGEWVAAYRSGVRVPD